MNSLSIVVHGQIRDETQATLDSVASIFDKSELIFSSAKNDINYGKLSINERYKTIKYDEPGIFEDYGFFSRNYLRHIFSAQTGIEASKGEYILKIRSDIKLNKIKIPNIQTIKKYSYFHYNAKIRPIFVFPYYHNLNFMNGDMIIYGHRDEIELLLSCRNKCDYINIENTTIFPSKLPSVSDSFLTPEEVMYMSYIKKIFSKQYDISYDEILGNNSKHLIDLNKIILKLDVNCDLPKRIDDYVFGIKGKLNAKYRYSKIYRLIYSIYNKLKTR